MKPQQRWGLKAKLISAMLAVGAVPLLIGLGVAFYRGTHELHQTAGANFASLAAESARGLDLVFSDELLRTSRIAAHPLVVRALEEREDHLFALDQQARQVEIVQGQRRWEAHEAAFVRTITEGPLADLLKQQAARPDETAGPILPAATRAATRALFITDSSGSLVTSMTDLVAYVHADAAWWKGAYQNGVGQPYLGNLAFNERLGTYVFHLSVPVMDRIRYRAIGVLHRIYDAKEYLAPSLMPIRFGKTGHVMLIDNAGFVMLCPILPTGTRLPDADLVSLVTLLQPGWVKAPSDGHGGRSTSIIGFSPLPGTSRLTRDSTGATWHTFAWQASEELFAPTRQFMGWVAGFGMLALVLLGGLGYVAAAKIVTPIRRLQHSAGLIGRGELTEPISIRTGDELEQLAEDMNRMNAQLRRTFSGLTDTVEEKTRQVVSLQIMNQQILQSVPNPIVLLDAAGRVDYLNGSADQAFGMNVEALGMPLEDLLGLDHRSAQRLKAELQAQLQGIELAPLDNHEKEVRDPLAPLSPTQQRHGAAELLIHHNIYEYQWFRMTARRSEDARIGLIFRNITEERRLQDKVVQAEKSSGLSVLVSGIGHELNNPLSGIMGLGEAIDDETDLTVIKEHARSVVTQARRMADVIQSLIGQSYIGDENGIVRLDLNELLKGLLEQLLGPGSEGLKIKTNYGTVPPVQARPAELGDAFRHVLINALHAMGGKGVLELTTQAANGQVSVSIRDTGCGIPSAYLPKVFDPFFTTKRQGEGRGLGLTTTRRVVESFGGEVAIESEEGRGTTVVITLPACDSAAMGRMP